VSILIVTDIPLSVVVMSSCLKTTIVAKRLSPFKKLLYKRKRPYGIRH